MQYRRLGKSGLQVSVLSYGSWVTFAGQIDDDVADACMTEAYEQGVNFFDNAEAYAGGQSEIMMGKVLKKKQWSRDTYSVSSKVFWGGKKPTQRGLSRKHVVEACHAALKRLHVDYLDLYFCHRPDVHTPIEETVRAMHDLITQGKVLYWGTSEWSAQQITEACAAAHRYNLIPPTMEQPEYNMFHRERVEVEYQPLYKNFGLGTTIWSPLASGLLTGKYNNGIPENSRANSNAFSHFRAHLVGEEAEEKINRVKELTKVAHKLDTNMARLALAWCLKNPYISTVITGATNREQVKDNMQAIDVVDRLTNEVMETIEVILKNKPEESATY